MAAPKATGPDPGDLVFPSTQGVVSGIVGIALVVLLVVVIAVDGWGLAGLRVQIALVIFGVLTWALMLRPRIRLQGGRLVLVNPFHRISVPLHLIDLLEVRSVTKVHVGARTLVGIAVGRRTRQLVRPTSMGAPGGPFALGARGVRGDVDTPAPGADTADLLEDWVNRAADDARRDAKVVGTPAGGVVRTPNLPLYAVLGALALALAVTLVL